MQIKESIVSIKLTEAAVEQIRKSAGESAAGPMALRIAAKRREDGSIEYAMGFDDEAEVDTTSEYDDLTILVAPTSIDLLSGAILDFVQLDGGEQRFIFLNPNDPSYVPPGKD
jgi:iron-sulfur cluster assembly protein